ncbi:MAG: hypothetical protein KGJ13_03655 [Patescibacteria group bacterium]|nr:hypothetical protein [Patescibacteria group bacterium]MDE2019418.1 hypothetical protein [Patescibacteria group bacterium]
MQKTYHFTKAKKSELRGTSFNGYLRASYADLVGLLEKPHDRTKEGSWESSDKKVRAEWAFKFGPTVITIYDYKDPRPIEAVDIWHVGSKGNNAAVGNFFRLVMRIRFEDRLSDP